MEARAARRDLALLALSAAPSGVTCPWVKMDAKNLALGTGCRNRQEDLHPVLLHGMLGMQGDDGDRTRAPSAWPCAEEPGLEEGRARPAHLESTPKAQQRKTRKELTFQNQKEKVFYGGLCGACPPCPGPRIQFVYTLNCFFTSSLA